MADYKRSNTRYHSNYRSSSNISNNNINVSNRDYVPETNCNCNRPNSNDNFSPQWLEKYPIGMGYVPMQQFDNIYDMEVGLQRGTIFAQLDYPFEIGFCARGCNC